MFQIRRSVLGSIVLAGLAFSPGCRDNTASTPASAGGALVATGASQADRAHRFGQCWSYFDNADWANFAQCYDSKATADDCQGEELQAREIAKHTGQPLAVAVGKESAVERARGFKASFPDSKTERLVTLVNGSRSAGILTVKGSHGGDLRSPMGNIASTGKPVRFYAGHTIVSDASAKITSQSFLADITTPLAQIGALREVTRDLAPAAAPAVVIAKGDAREVGNLRAYDAHIAAFNQHDAGAFAATLSDKLVRRDVTLPRDADRAATLRTSGEFWSAFSNGKLAVSSRWAAGDWVVSQGSLTGTHDAHYARYQLAKTGKKVEVPFIEMARFDGGKVVESWMFQNAMVLKMHLGILPERLAQR